MNSDNWEYLKFHIEYYYEKLLVSSLQLPNLIFSLVLFADTKPCIGLVIL